MIDSDPDAPIAYTLSGRPVYDNAATVVCMIIPTESGKLLAVRRGRDPGKGLIGLPAGFHMRGETWEEAGAREAREETGAIVKNVRQVGSTVTDEYGHNLIFAISDTCHDFESVVTPNEETLEVLHLDSARDLSDWAFPLHYRAAEAFFWGGWNLIGYEGDTNV